MVFINTYTFPIIFDYNAFYEIVYIMSFLLINVFKINRVFRDVAQSGSAPRWG